MKNVFGICLTLAAALTPYLIHAQDGKSKAAKDAPVLIDKLFIPAAAKAEFYERLRINRDFIRKLPGFIRDVAYEHPDGDGNIICLTIAEWESVDALNKAKEAVQAEYKREGFNPGEMMKRLNITLDRNIYARISD